MITQEELKSFAEYDADTGIFTRTHAPCNSVKVGDKLGWINSSKKNELLYESIEYKGSIYKLHRLAFLYMTGKFPDNDVDHIDGNGLNNKWNNLRDVHHAINGRNRRLNANNKSGQAGVSYFRQTKKWRAAINDEFGKKKHLGYFDTLDEAIKVRRDAEKQMNYHNNHGVKR